MPSPLTGSQRGRVVLDFSLAQGESGDLGQGRMDLSISHRQSCWRISLHTQCTCAQAGAWPLTLGRQNRLTALASVFLSVRLGPASLPHLSFLFLFSRGVFSIRRSTAAAGVM